MREESAMLSLQNKQTNKNGAQGSAIERQRDSGLDSLRGI